MSDLGVLRSYGQNENYQRIQYKYMEERLKAWKSGKLNFGGIKRTIKQLEKDLGVNEKINSNISNNDILLKKINNIEKLLVNEKFLSNVSDKILEIKKTELNMLKTELNSLSL